MKPEAVLLLISDLEGAHHHSRVLGFHENQKTLREMCDPLYKLYFKLKKDQKNGELLDD